MNKTSRLSIILISIPVLWSCLTAVAKPPEGKAQSPVNITISATQTPKLGKAVEFIVNATARFDTDKLVINVHPPKGMVLNSGDLTWQGAANRGQPKVLRFNASFTEPSQKNISVNAFVRSPSGSRFGARAEYVLPWAQSQVRSLNKSATPRQRGERGVVEYALP